MDETKKEQEREIVKTFLKSEKLDFKLLEDCNAKKAFADYTGENPDAIIFDGKQYIGIELFSLVLSNTKGNNQFVNLAHRQSKFPKIIRNNDDFANHLTALNRYGLARQDDIEEVLIQEIPDKIRKLHLYCTERIWLLGYADEVAYQAGIVKRIKEDGSEKALRRRILTNISIPSKIEKIILFETGTSCKNYVFYLWDCRNRSMKRLAGVL